MRNQAGDTTALFEAIQTNRIGTSPIADAESALLEAVRVRTKEEHTAHRGKAGAVTVTSALSQPPQPACAAYIFGWPSNGACRNIAHSLSLPDCRLLTIWGLGGIGKTRLALAAGEEQLSSSLFPDGVFHVPLASLAALTRRYPLWQQPWTFHWKRRRQSPQVSAAATPGLPAQQAPAAGAGQPGTSARGGSASSPTSCRRPQASRYWRLPGNNCDCQANKSFRWRAGLPNPGKRPGTSARFYSAAPTLLGPGAPLSCRISDPTSRRRRRSGADLPGGRRHAAGHRAGCRLDRYACACTRYAGSWTRTWAFWLPEHRGVARPPSQHRRPPLTHRGSGSPLKEQQVFARAFGLPRRVYTRRSRAGSRCVAQTAEQPGRQVLCAL